MVGSARMQRHCWCASACAASTSAWPAATLPAGVAPGADAADSRLIPAQVLHPAAIAPCREGKTRQQRQGSVCTDVPQALKLALGIMPGLSRPLPRPRRSNSVSSRSKTHPGRRQFSACEKCGLGSERTRRTCGGRGTCRRDTARRSFAMLGRQACPKRRPEPTDAQTCR